MSPFLRSPIFLRSLTFLRGLIFLLLVFQALQINSSFAQNKNSSQNPAIKILVASWCVHCRDLENFLQKQGFGYTKLDIEKDVEGRKVYQQLGGGGVPMVIIGNSVLKGFDRNAILEMMNRSAKPAAMIQLSTKSVS